jgi:hypothetical protein
MQDYVVNVEEVLNNKSLPSWIYKCAFELQVQSYLPTGEFFEKLDDEELLHLKECAEKIRTKDFTSFEINDIESQKNLQNLCLLCFLLALGEGIAEINPEALSSMLESLFMLIAIDGMHRNNILQAIRKNYSLLDSTNPVVKGKK